MSIMGVTKMTFGDPTSTFFAFDTASGERAVCILDSMMDGATRGFEVLSRGLDTPARGSWNPATATLTLDGSTITVAEANIDTARAVSYSPADGTVTLADQFGTYEPGIHLLYPGYFDSVPAGQRLDDIRATDELPEPPEPDDEVDWADHHIAEARALARAESLI